MSRYLFRDVDNNFTTPILQADGQPLPLDKITNVKYEISKRPHAEPILTKVLNDGIVKGETSLVVSIPKAEMDFHGEYWHTMTITDVDGKVRPPVINEKVTIK